MAAKNDNITKDPVAAAKKKIGKHWKQKRTIIREKLEVKEIDDLKQRVLDNFEELSRDKDMQVRAMANRELAKYLFPQKRQIEGKFEGNINISFTY